jgi:D-alanyl-D-alanine carboxypeptidase
MRRTPIVLAAALAAIAAPGCGEKADGDASTGISDAMQAVVDAGVPAVWGVVEPAGEERISLAAGGPEPGAQEGVSASETARIASVSKAFQGAVVLSLVDDGRLDLDDTVADVVGPIVRGAARITVADLLRHSSGLPEYTTDEAFLEDFAAGEAITPAAAISYVADEPPTFAPGKEFAYSDTDNLVLAEIVAEVTGASYRQALQTRVLGPLGLSVTELARGPETPLPEVPGYQFDRDDPDAEPAEVTTALDPLAAGASGALVSSAEGVAAFFAALRSGELFGRKLLERSDETIPGDSSPPGPPGAGTNAAGLAIFRYELPCGEFWGHTGTFPGYVAFGGASPNGSASFAVLANASDLPAEADERLTELWELVACRSIGEGP